MPIASIRGVDINYEVLGDHGPWVALQPGGRRALGGVKSLAEKLAEAGNRVLIYDRRNCGASGVAFEGNSENEVWAEDLRELLTRARRLAGVYRRQLVGLPAGLAAGVAPPGGGARAVAVAGDRRRLRGRAAGAELLQPVHRPGAKGRHGSDLPTASISARSSPPTRPTAPG